MNKSWWRCVSRPAAMLAIVGFVGGGLLVAASVHPPAHTPGSARWLFGGMIGVGFGFFGLLSGAALGTIRWAAAQRHRLPLMSPGWPKQAPQPSVDTPLVYGQQPAPGPAPHTAGQAPPAHAPRPHAPPTNRPISTPLAPLRPAPEPAARPVVDLQDPERLNRVLDELDNMPGLAAVADQVRTMARRAAHDHARRARGLAVAETGLHCLFLGPPGTGKTSVARVWGRALAAIGLLSSGHVIEVDRSGLVGDYVGATALKTNAAIDRALGGVLFVDEAYALSVPDNPRDFGAEAVAMLVKRMEDDRGKFVVICAGYPAEMDRFLASNTGLQSRFARTVTFPDYDAASLTEILMTMAAAADYELTDVAREAARAALTRLAARPPKGWANARSVRRLLDAAIDATVERLDKTGDTDPDAISTLTANDLHAAVAHLHPREGE